MCRFSLFNSVAAFVLVQFLFASCDKVDRTKKKFSGTWNVYSYRLIDHNGFTHEYPASGTVYFEFCENESCAYTLNLTYDVSGNSLIKAESGLYHLKDSEYYELYRNSTGTIDTLDYGRILLLTRKDLKTEFKDDDGIHVLVLEK